MELENTKVGDTVTAVETTEEQPKGRFYTDEEIALLQQKAGDKRISQFQKTLDKKNREADKLSKMSDDEKYRYELEERERQIEEKERALVLAENKNAVSKILSEKGLSLQLVDFCVDEDAEEMQKKIAILEKAFKASVKAEVEKRIGSTTPKKAMDDDTITKEDFRKLSLAQQQELFNTNPTLYKTLTTH